MPEESEYLVVEFPEEVDDDGVVSMAIISSKWTIVEDNMMYCIWPYYIKTDLLRTKTLVNHADIDMTRSAKCPIEIKYRTAIYKVALSKLKRLEEMTSVSQSDEGERDEAGLCSKKRHPIKNRLLSSSASETTDEDIPIVPKFKKNSGIQGSSESSGSCRDANSSSRARVFHRSQNTLCTVTESGKQSASTPTSSMPSSMPLRVREHLLHTPNSEDLSETPSTISGATKKTICLNCRQNSGLIQQLFTKVETMDQNIKYIITMIQQQMGSELININDGTNLGLPVKSSEDVNTLNTLLEDANEFAKMCQFLQTIGGKDVQDATRRILSRLISNNLALSYNWSGRNDKKSFSNLKNVLKLLTVAVRKNPFSKNATQQEIEAVVKVWLRNASDRDGGRSKRKNNQTLNLALNDQP